MVKCNNFLILIHLADNGNISEFKGTSSEIIVNNALEFIEKNVNDNKPSFAVIWDGSPHTLCCD